jgi:hypothetical protein
MKTLGRIFLAVIFAGMVCGISAQTVWTVEKTVNGSTSGNPGKVFCVGNLFIGFGWNSSNAKYEIDTSSDGINWAFCSYSPALFTSLVKVGSHYVAVKEGGAIAISPNGSNWTFKTLPFNFSGIASSGSLLIAICSDTANGTILSSTNGTTWNVSSQSGSALNAIIWTGTKFIAVGHDGRYVTSVDGSTWTGGNIPLRPSLSAVTWTGAYIVANGVEGGSFVSTDGNNWTIAATPIPSTGAYYTRQLLWSGKALVRTVDPNIVETSTDGIYWNMQVSSQFASLSTLVFTGTKFLVYGTTNNNSTYVILSSPIDSSITSPLSKKQSNNVAAAIFRSGVENTIHYSLTEQAQVRLRYFDLLGREVFSGIDRAQGPGSYVFQIPSSALATGRYVQVFEAGQFVKKDMITMAR